MRLCQTWQLLTTASAGTPFQTPPYKQHPGRRGDPRSGRRQNRCLQGTTPAAEASIRYLGRGGQSRSQDGHPTQHIFAAANRAKPEANRLLTRAEPDPANSDSAGRAAKPKPGPTRLNGNRAERRISNPRRQGSTETKRRKNRMPSLHFPTEKAWSVPPGRRS